MIGIIKIADTICIFTYGCIKTIKYLNKCGLTVCFEHVEQEQDQDN